MFTDPEKAGDTPVGDGPIGDDLPSSLQPLPEGQPIASEETAFPSGESDPFSGESVFDPAPSPSARRDQQSSSRWRRRLGGIAPAVILVPLALASFIVFVLKPDGLGPARPAAQAAPTEAATVTPLPATPRPIEAIATPAPPAPSPEAIEVWLAQAEALTWKSEFEQAIDIYRELARQMPGDARPRAGWARVLILDGLPDQALSHARQAVDLDPTSVEAALALARAYVDVGDKARGLSAALDALRLDQDNAGAHTLLARVYLLSGQFDRAVEEAEQALAQDPRNAEAHRIRGELYEAVDQDIAQAIGEYRIAADLQPELWLRHYELGLALLKGENFEEAIVALTNAWVQHRKPLTYHALGEAYYRLGQYDQAASFLEQSLSAGAKDANTFAFLSAIYAQQDRCGDAAVFFKQALALDPNNPQALQARDACQQAGQALTPIPAASPPAASAGEPSPSPPAVTGTEPSPSPPPALRGQIAFPVWNAERTAYDTYVANTDGSERQLVAEEVHQPAFSPDGQWLAVNGEREEHLNLCLVQPDGSGLREITEHVEDGLPSWSLDGQSLVFSSTRHGDRQSRIYVIDQVPPEGQKAPGRPLNYGLDDVRGEYPAWTAGGQIVYSGCLYEGLLVQCGLLAVSAEPDPQTPTPLTTHPEDSAPAVYGSRIAFMSNRDGNWEIYVVNLDGSGLVRLTNNVANDGLPAWSPDGQTIAFISDQGGVWAVWAVYPDGSGRRKLFDLGNGGLASDWQHERISWSSAGR
jgi:tetratricopeptide (TPR) repeat protein